MAEPRRQPPTASATYTRSTAQESWGEPPRYTESARPIPPSSSAYPPSSRPQIPRIDSTERKRRRLTLEEQGRTYPYNAPGSSRGNPLDLTFHPQTQANRVLNPPPGVILYPTRRESRMAQREVTVPRWEPDSDVVKCPVCQTDFGMFFRKHHCRKCGRVVCSNCSPHRITIPREYIVQPTTTPDGTASSPGGAEVVRVCKPCVPDPWTPASQPVRSQAPPSRPTSFVQPRPHDPDDRVRSTHVRRFSSPPRNTAMPPHSSSAPMTSTRPPRPASYAYARPPPPPPPQTLRSPQRGIPTPPRPRVREEDECPVCGIELAPGEALREEHIQTCIASRFGTPASPTALSRPGPLPAGGATTASSSTPPPSTNIRQRAQSYRSRGIFPYIATEKDCLDGDSREQECAICMEEFQPGDEMGRLECLCRFHRPCIREWWARKGPGVCPVHASHE